MSDFEIQINATDIDYDSEDVFLSGVFIKKTHLNLRLSNKALMVKVMRTWLKFFEVHGQKCWIPISGRWFVKKIIISLIKNIKNNFGISSLLRNVDQEWLLLIKVNHFVKSMIATLIVLMERENTPETLHKEC